MLMPVVFMRRKVRSFKKNSLIEDSVSVAEQLDQFLGPNFYSWLEMMLSLICCLLEKEVGTYASMGKEYRGKIGLWREAERERILRINCIDYCHCLCDC